MNNELYGLLSLININTRFIKPVNKLNLKLYNFSNHLDLLNELEKYSTYNDYDIIVNFWLNKYYNYKCSTYVEKLISGYSYAKLISKNNSNDDIKLTIDNKSVNFDVKLTPIISSFKIEDNDFININNSDKINLKENLAKSLYDNFKESRKFGVNNNENRIYVLIKSKSSNKENEIKTKANFDLLKNTIDIYFSDINKIKDIMFEYKNKKVIVLPILVD